MIFLTNLNDPCWSVSVNLWKCGWRFVCLWVRAMTDDWPPARLLCTACHWVRREDTGFHPVACHTNTNQLKTRECYDYRLHCKKPTTPLSALASLSAVQVKKHAYTHREPPLQITDDCCFAQCANREQVTVTGQSDWAGTTVKAQHTEQSLGRK